MPESPGTRNMIWRMLGSCRSGAAEEEEGTLVSFSFEAINVCKDKEWFLVGVGMAMFDCRWIWMRHGSLCILFC